MNFLLAGCGDIMVKGSGHLNRLSVKSLSSWLTVVVCSYERPRELRKALSFFGQSSGLRAIVIDGSERPIDAQFLDSIPSERIRYVHEPTPSLLKRLTLAASLVTTPYTVLMFDDEYYVPSALKKAIQFLEEHSDYVSCGGQVLGFHVQRGSVIWTPVYANLRGFELSSTDPWDRVTTHLSNYRIASYCSVVRTKHWAGAWESIGKSQFPAYATQELQFECAISFAGKLKILPDLFWLRNQQVPSILNVDVEGLDDTTYFHTWWTKESSTQERETFIKATVDALANTVGNNQLNRDRRSAAEFLHLAFSRYSMGWNQKTSWYGKSGWVARIISSVMSGLAGRLRIIRLRLGIYAPPRHLTSLIAPQSLNSPEIQILSSTILRD